MNKLVLVLGGVVAFSGVVYAVSLKSNDSAVSLEQAVKSEELAMKEKDAMENIAITDKVVEDIAMTETKTMTEQVVSTNDAMMDAGKEINKTEGEIMMKKDESAMMAAGTYQPYSEDKLALADTGSVVLFFKASWCPSCKTVDADIKSNLSNIPKGLAILEVDYDTSAALKQKYGVTYQHTFVQVDSKGNMITKWSGSPTLADLVTKIK